jgi:hypothetical protein
MEAINAVNGPGAMSSAWVALILMSFVLEAAGRKVLIAIFILIIPAIEGQATDLLIGFGFVCSMFPGLGFFRPPAFGLRDPEEQRRNRFIWSDCMVRVFWDSVCCCLIAVYAIVQVKYKQACYQVWQLGVLLVICFSTHLVVFVWVCIKLCACNCTCAWRPCWRDQDD